MNINSSLLDELFTEIKKKSENGDVNKSYTAFLVNAGINNVVKKVLEEANEVCEAVLQKDDEQVILESADLLFHLLVLLAAKNIELKAVIEELNRRRNIVDLSEKSIAKNKAKLS